MRAEEEAAFADREAYWIGSWTAAGGDVADQVRFEREWAALPHPARAAVQDFTPFWEFVSGPAHAGAFGPNALDATFGPDTAFVHAPPVANASPAQGYQHFGEVSIDARSRAFTVHLRDRDGVSLFTTTLCAPEREVP